MKTITAVYGNGVFRPTGPADQPEGCEARVELKVEEARRPQPTDPEFAHLDAGSARNYAILSRRRVGPIGPGGMPQRASTVTFRAG